MTYVILYNNGDLSCTMTGYEFAYNVADHLNSPALVKLRSKHPVAILKIKLK